MTDDPQDRPWRGRWGDADNTEPTQMTDYQERLRALESIVAEIRIRQSEMELVMRQTSETTAQIKADTNQIVMLIKGAGVLGYVVRWLGGFSIIYVIGVALKWWE